MKKYLGLVALSAALAGVITVFIAGHRNGSVAAGTTLGTAIDDSVAATRVRFALVASRNIGA